MLTEGYTYNGNAELTQRTLTGAVNHTYSYGYKDNAARSLEHIGFGTYKFCPQTDVNGRNTGREIYNGTEQIAGEYIRYRKVGDHATNMPSAVWFGMKREAKEGLKYRYDASGNISEITQNGHIAAKYAYDALGRLIREDNKSMNKTVLFTYDENGNITERCEYAYTSKTGEELAELSGTHYGYVYDGDKLISYNGENCAYNASGNPTTYRGKAIEWQYGNRLTKYGTTTFAYDGAGRRVSKGNIAFTYDSDGRLIKQSDGLEFIYDHSGIAGVKYNGNIYFYRKDAQGNIMALLDNNGAVVVEYKYDAWGNHEAEVADEEYSVLAEKNPFRYRGYYYDTETNLYYLQTRYYDPEVGRFISQDDVSYLAPDSINGLNLYAYCSNNPVMATDPTGTDWSGFFTLLERIFTGISELCRYIVKYPEKFRGSWKRARKINHKLSKRAFNRSWETALKETKALGKTLGKVATVLSFLSLAADIGNVWINNYESGKSTWVSDSVVDTVYIGGRFAIGWGITALCTALIPIPIFGTAIGVLVSLAVDHLIQFVVSETGALGSIKSWAADVGSDIAEGWNYFWSFAWI